MKIAACIKIIALSVSLISLAQSAFGQIRINQRLHSTAGSCSGCDLSKTTMNGLKIHDSDFSSSLFNGSNLSGASFDRSNLSGAHFKKALLLRAEGRQVDMSGADFRDTTWTEASLLETNFKQANLYRADLTRTTFNKSDFSGASLIGAIAPDSKFKDTHFVGARLDHVNLKNADLSRGIFHDAKFGNAILLGANLDGADFSSADLSQAQGLKQEQLDEACGNMNTVLPVGLSVAYCKANDFQTHSNIDHHKLPPHMKRAAADLDEAMATLEKLMSDPPESKKKLKRKLQAIHADLAASRKAIER